MEAFSSGQKVTDSLPPWIHTSSGSERQLEPVSNPISIQCTRKVHPFDFHHVLLFCAMQVKPNQSQINSRCECKVVLVQFHLTGTDFRAQVGLKLNVVSNSFSTSMQFAPGWFLPCNCQCASEIGIEIDSFWWEWRMRMPSGPFSRFHLIAVLNNRALFWTRKKVFHNLQCE